MTSPSIKWVTAPDARRVFAETLTELIIADPSYICLDEYVDGFSPDGMQWRDKAAEDFAAFLIDTPVDTDGRTRYFLEARAPDGAFTGGTVVLAGDNGTERYLIIEDLVVAPNARRKGIAAALLNFLKDHARAEGVHRLLLESGVHNKGAKTLFRDIGFKPLSTLYTLSL